MGGGGDNLIQSYKRTEKILVFAKCTRRKVVPKQWRGIVGARIIIWQLCSVCLLVIVYHHSQLYSAKVDRHDHRTLTYVTCPVAAQIYVNMESKSSKPFDKYLFQCYAGS